MAVVEVRLYDKDRETLGGPEWVPLDFDRLIDTPAHMLERWEAECGYAIERALAEVTSKHPPAKAVRVIVWLARKQNGANADAVDEDGKPESFDRLSDIRTMPVRIRDRVPEAEPDADAVPPDQSEPTSPEPS